MAVPSVEQAVCSASRSYVLPAGFRPSYGTAGFRAVADLLHSTMFRRAGPQIASLTCQPPLLPRQHPRPGLQVRHHDGGPRPEDAADHRHLHHRLPQPRPRQRRQAGGAVGRDAVPGVGGAAQGWPAGLRVWHIPGGALPSHPPPSALLLPPAHAANPCPPCSRMRTSWPTPRLTPSWPSRWRGCWRRRASRRPPLASS